MTTIDKLSKDAVMPIGEANTLVTYFNNTDDWHYKVIHVGEEDAKILIIDPADGYELGYMQDKLEDTTPQEFTNNMMGQLHDMTKGIE